MKKKKKKKRFEEFSLTPNLEYFTPNFLFLTPTFWKVLTEKYSKTPNFFFWKIAFLVYPYFQNPSENSCLVGCRYHQIISVLSKYFI